MHSELIKMIDAIVEQDDASASHHFREYVTEKTKRLVAEATQGDMFGQADTDAEDAPKFKFLVKPVGVGYNDVVLAKAAAKNHMDKDVTVVDTTSGSIVYSHKGNRRKSK
jgi:hypothetical protein